MCADYHATPTRSCMLLIAAVGEAVGKNGGAAAHTGEGNAGNGTQLPAASDQLNSVIDYMCIPIR